MTRRDDLVARAKRMTPHLLNGACNHRDQEAAGHIMWELIEALTEKEDAPMTPVASRGMHD